MRPTLAIALILTVFTALAAEGRGRVSQPAPTELNPDIPAHPLGGVSISHLIGAAGIAEPFTMSAIDWRLRAAVRPDTQYRLGEADWLARQNVTSGEATIHVWRQRGRKYCRTQTFTLPIAVDSSVIVPLNATLFAPGDMIWFEYWPAYTVHIEGATSFGVWSTFTSITQSYSTNEPHPWFQVVDPADVGCD